jgi:purine-binding chemotaxis protein CheW
MSETNFAQETSSPAALLQSSDEGQLVVFRLSDEEFGLDINDVREIVRLPDIMPIPRSPDYVAGICNLRGSVLPVIDTRLRFSMDAGEKTDHTRLLVVEANGMQTGLVVDDMREVIRMSDSLEEPPPSVCKGVDREFLRGVVKMDEGKRLILKLDLPEVLAIGVEASDRTAAASSIAERAATVVEDAVDEEQLVSFEIAGEEYAFDIARVREILRVTETTEVPNVPDYVKGLFTIRNQLLPILDLRGILGITDLVSERLAIVDKAVAEQRRWSQSLRDSLEGGRHFTGVLDARKTSFGQWLETYNTSSIEIETILKRVKRYRADLFHQAEVALDLRTAGREAAVARFEAEIEPRLKLVLDSVEELKAGIEKHIAEEQRVMVVEAGGTVIGYLVDRVNEVIRIPRSVIDDTPSIASSERRELKGVAKLDRGDRLIMIMDESSLISRETTRALSGMQAGETTQGGSGEVKERSLAQQSLEEEQLVTFTINQEEYGIRIMQVQEINRASEITSVPRAPRFVDGVTNLRGNVVPVINVRELFGLNDKDVDDRTRIIIVDIAGSKTGLRVDQVNEVMRLPKQDIETTPSLVTAGGANRYMAGVCKMNGGARMVVLLDVQRILDTRELETLHALTHDGEAGASFEDEAAGGGTDKKRLTRKKSA